MLIDRIESSLTPLRCVPDHRRQPRSRRRRLARDPRPDSPGARRRRCALRLGRPDARRRRGRGDCRAVLVGRPRRTCRSDCVLHYADRPDLPWGDDAPDLADRRGARAGAPRARQGTGPSWSSPRRGRCCARCRRRAATSSTRSCSMPGATLDLEEAAERLARMGYERVDLAEERGQLRGPRRRPRRLRAGDATYPVRAELFGDEIETLKRYVPSHRPVDRRQRAGRGLPLPRARARRACREARREGARASRRSRDPIVAHDLELHRAGRLLQRHRALPAAALQAGRGAPPTTSAPTTLVGRRRAALAVRRRRPPPTRSSTALAEAAARARRSTASTSRPRSSTSASASASRCCRCMRAGGGGRRRARRRGAPRSPGGEERFVGGVRALAEQRLRGRARGARPPCSRRGSRDALADAGVPLTERARSRRAPTAPRTTTARPLARGRRRPSPTPTCPPASSSPTRGSPSSRSTTSTRARSTRRARREIDPTRVTFAFAPGDYVVHADARHRAVPRDRAPGGARRGARLPAARVREGRQALRAGRADRPRHQVRRARRRRAAGHAAQHRRLVARRPARRARPPRKLAFDLVDLYARRATVDGLRLRPGHAVAARDGGDRSPSRRRPTSSRRSPT